MPVRSSHRLDRSTANRISFPGGQQPRVAIARAHGKVHEEGAPKTLFADAKTPELQQFIGSVA